MRGSHGPKTLGRGKTNLGGAAGTRAIGVRHILPVPTSLPVPCNLPVPIDLRVRAIPIGFSVLAWTS